MDDAIGDELAALKKPYKAGPAAAMRFRLIAFNDISLDTTPAYLVRGIIPREGLVVIWGPPKCAKTFWVYNLVMHIALGWEYRGRRVAQGTVVYVACEGERGLGARVEAFRRKRLTQDGINPRFHLLATRLDLVAERQQLIDDIRAQLGEDLPAAVVIDTLNRSIAGSESSDEDMGAYVKAADAIREAFHCAVVIVHHCGLDDNRPRGHTSLRGAADAEISIKRDAAGLITSSVIWMKDGPSGEEETSLLEIVNLGIDSDGEEITSCVIEPSDAPAEADAGRKKRRRIAPEVLRALDFLKDTIVEHGEPLNRPGYPNVRATKLDHWRELVRKRGLFGADATGRQRFARAKDRLIAEQMITIDEDLVWLVPSN